MHLFISEGCLGAAYPAASNIGIDRVDEEATGQRSSGSHGYPPALEAEIPFGVELA